MALPSVLRLVASASLLAGFLTVPSLAATTQLWTEKASGGLVTLTYGPLDPKEPSTFLLSCLNGVGIAVLSVNMDFPDVPYGTPITIELSAGDGTASVAGETARDETNDVTYGEAGDIDMKPILEVLKKDGPVTMKVEEASVEMSVHGRADAVERFVKDCDLI